MDTKLTLSLFIISGNGVEFGPRILLAHQAISHLTLDEKGKNEFSNFTGI